MTPIELVHRRRQTYLRKKEHTIQHTTYTHMNTQHTVTVLPGCLYASPQVLCHKVMTRLSGAHEIVVGTLQDSGEWGGEGEGEGDG